MDSWTIICILYTLVRMRDYSLYHNHNYAYAIYLYACVNKISFFSASPEPSERLHGGPTEILHNRELIARVSALELVAQLCCLLCANLGTERARSVRAKRFLA